MIDKIYCSSHYLAFRFIADENVNFFDGLTHKIFKPRNANELTKIATNDDMQRVIKAKIDEFFIPNKTAILLSGGMDSAILASFLPKGTKAYTFKCVAKDAIDETQRAKKYCEIYDLRHEIIEMKWADFELLTPEILRFDKVPFHSIEVQLVKAAKVAKSQGIERLIIGDSADYVFGGMDGLLAKDWDFDEFVHRYTFTEPSRVLREFTDTKAFFEKFRLANNKIDFVKLTQSDMLTESLNSYANAFEKEQISWLDPYSFMVMAKPLDLKRVRNGESKYLVRELFKKRYLNLAVPDKIPMPRAMDVWLENYSPKRAEFKANCVKFGGKNGGAMSGDQKWQLYCLETFLNLHDKGAL